MQQLLPSERLAKRICQTANARAISDAGAVIASLRQRTRTSAVDAAVELAIAKQWLRFDGVAYIVTQAGADLGRQSRTGQRTRRVTPY
jgi:hypothetical protein